MNKEIEQLIEQEANDYALDGHNKSRLYADTEIEMFKRDGYKDGAISVLEKWKEANRWRKVEEELPENNEMVLIKDADKCVSIGYYSSFIGEFIDQVTAETEDTTEWMSIPE